MGQINTFSVSICFQNSVIHQALKDCGGPAIDTEPRISQHFPNTFDKEDLEKLDKVDEKVDTWDLLFSSKRKSSSVFSSIQSVIQSYVKCLAPSGFVESLVSTSNVLKLC